jgi:hypothetical protein
MQQFLKSPARKARAWIVATELLTELFEAANDARSALDPGLGRETLPSFTGDLETSWRRGVLS